MLSLLLDTWTSFYSNHASLRTAIEFIHIGGLMLGGGCAIAADLATIEAVREGPIGRTSQFHALNRTHAIQPTRVSAEGRLFRDDVRVVRPRVERCRGVAGWYDLRSAERG
jgi:hypothetical protein